MFFTHEHLFYEYFARRSVGKATKGINVKFRIVNLSDAFKIEV